MHALNAQFSNLILTDNEPQIVLEICQKLPTAIDQLNDAMGAIGRPHNHISVSSQAFFIHQRPYVTYKEISKYHRKRVELGDLLIISTLDNNGVRTASAKLFQAKKSVVGHLRSIDDHQTFLYKNWPEFYFCNKAYTKEKITLCSRTPQYGSFLYILKKESPHDASQIHFETLLEIAKIKILKHLGPCSLKVFENKSAYKSMLWPQLPESSLSSHGLENQIEPQSNSFEKLICDQAMFNIIGEPLSANFLSSPATQWDKLISQVFHYTLTQIRQKQERVFSTKNSPLCFKELQSYGAESSISDLFVTTSHKEAKKRLIEQEGIVPPVFPPDELMKEPEDGGMPTILIHTSIGAD